MTPSRRHRALRLTLQDLARIAGVSTMTVSHALRHSKLVNEETRSRIQAQGRKHGYRPNLSARSLRAGPACGPRSPNR